MKNKTKIQILSVWVRLLRFGLIVAVTYLWKNPRIVQVHEPQRHSPPMIRVHPVDRHF